MEDTSLGVSRAITEFTQGLKDGSGEAPTPTGVRNMATLNLDDEMLLN
jgi:hypothetical protein